MNLKAGFRIPLSSDKRWILKVLGGYYYSTTLTSTYGTGYHNVQGPEIYPSLIYNFSSERTAWVYFKLSPMMNQISFLHPSNFEAAVGGGWIFLPMTNGRGLGVTFDVASLKLFLDNKSVLSNTYTLGANYRF